MNLNFNSYKFLMLLVIILTSNWTAHAQCPTITNSTQSFCDLESPTIASLQAIDNGGGIYWYNSINSTQPIAPTTVISNGSVYFAGDATGNCVNRQSVTVEIYSAPTGPNFQGACVDDPNGATIEDLIAYGNSVQWFTTPIDGNPLPAGTILTNNTVYYAGQINPATGCQTSRLPVLVQISTIEAPTGNSDQYFCLDTTPNPTIADLTISSPVSYWYISSNSYYPLSPSTPLINGHTYYATAVNLPCESTTRLPVTVHIDEKNEAGTPNVLDLCEDDVNLNPIINLFDLLGGNPDTTGSWYSDSITFTNYLGTLDLQTLPFNETIIFTYLVDTNPACVPASSTITIKITPNINVGNDNQLEICPEDTNLYNLFDLLGPNAEVGGVWTPSLASGNGIFNPQVDALGIYTYSTLNSCNDFSEITITLKPNIDPAINVSLEICETDTTLYNLFDLLGPNAAAGGTWSPTLASGTNIFNPQIDTANSYTYTINNCYEPSTVNIIRIITPNAGNDNTIEVCSIETVDLFSLLGSDAVAGGTWSPSLASGTNILNPEFDNSLSYIYTISNECGTDSATINVTYTQALIAGTNNSVEICSDTTDNINLFSLLGSDAEVGGIWTPALASGTNIFNPQIDLPGNYTYSFTNPCSTTATVNVIINDILNPGNNATLSICQNDTNTYNLFDLLGPDAETGGTWSPALTSGTNIFNPQLDNIGVYTYNLNNCSLNSTVTINLINNELAGQNGILNICIGDLNSYNLFDYLQGNPIQGGTWSNNTGIFNLENDNPGIFTYTISDECGTYQANVNVVTVPERNAGISNTIDICFNSNNQINLFEQLNGNPDLGGIWTPTLASGNNIFNPQLDTAGVYTYSFNDTCSTTASVTVNIIPELNSGISNVISYCQGSSETIDLFTHLNGNPDLGGNWTPALSINGVFNPTTDQAGIYTYTLTNACGTWQSTIEVTEIPTLNPGENAIIDICENESDEFELFYLLNGNPDLGGTWSPALATEGIFNPDIDAFGTYTYSFNDGCSTQASITINKVTIPNTGTPTYIEVCKSDKSIYDLRYYLEGNPDLGGTWSPELPNGNGLFNPSTDNFGVYTYTLENECGISSQTITISEKDCTEDDFFIPDGFSPNDDGINDNFVINNIRSLYPKFKLEIYNRYGNILYKGDLSTPDWDGTTQEGLKTGNGKAPVGVYFYILEYNDGQKSATQGRLFLNR